MIYKYIVIHTSGAGHEQLTIRIVPQHNLCSMRWALSKFHLAFRLSYRAGIAREGPADQQPSGAVQEDLIMEYWTGEWISSSPCTE